MDDNSKYLELFFEETEENLLKLNELVLKLEENPADNSVVDEIFRSAHTLKGMAATMEFAEMAELTHKLENVFSVLKTQNREADEQIIALVFKSLDTLSELVEDIAEGRASGQDYLAVMEMCDRAVAAAEGQEIFNGSLDSAKFSEAACQPFLSTLDESDLLVAQAAEEEGLSAYVIAVQIAEDSMMKNARVFLVMSKLEEKGEILKVEPSADVLENEDFGTIFKLFYLTGQKKAAVQKTVQDINEIDSVKIATLEDSLQIQKAEKEKNTVSTVQTGETGKKSNSASHSHTAANQSIRVDIQKLDTFMGLISEMVVYRTQLESIGAQIGDFNLLDTLGHFSRITTELQSLVLNIRLQPLHTVTNRFPRMMRDLSNDLGKEFHFVVEGEDTELDRTIVSELSEPLIHLLRNSADHGIETPEKRKTLGKDPTGTIRISAYQEGNRVMITIADDGKGLDTEAIRESAERKGIATQGLDTKEIQELIFHPGFSTASQVTNVSGRGVGLDVVKSKIKELGGTIDIISEVDKGTTFRLNLPLTMSIIKSLIVQVGSHTFALPLSVIQKVNRVREEEIKEVHGGEVYLSGEKAVPVIRLERALEIASEAAEEFYVVMVSLEGKQFALTVDSFVGQQEIVIKELGKELGDKLNYLGAAIRGDGKIILILDVTAICLERNQVIHV